MSPLARLTLIALIALHGCDDATNEDSARLQGATCSSASITLEFTERLEFQRSDATLSLAYETGRHLARLGSQTRTVEWIDFSGDSSLDPDPTILSGLRNGPTGITGFSDRAVVFFSRIPGKAAEQPLLSPTPTGIRDIAFRTDSLWLVDGPEADRRFALYISDGARTWTRVAEAQANGNWRLLVGNVGVFAIANRRPFQLITLRVQSSMKLLVDTVAEVTAMPRTTDWFVQGFHAWGCGRAAVLLTDLESDRRRIARVDLLTGRVESEKEFHGAIGIVGTDTLRKEMVLYRALAEGGEVLVYRMKTDHSP